MRLDELFKNLGYLAATIGSQVRDNAFQGVPLEALDLTGEPPRKVALLGPAQVVLSEGEVFRVDVERGPSGEEVGFSLDEGKLGVAGGDAGSAGADRLHAAGRLDRLDRGGSGGCRHRRRGRRQPEDGAGRRRQPAEGAAAMVATP